VNADRRRTASALLGAVSVTDNNSELTGSTVTLLRKSSELIVSPRLTTVFSARVRVFKRLTSVAIAREESSSG
jgi:hypothetical protein